MTRTGLGRKDWSHTGEQQVWDERRYVITAVWVVEGWKGDVQKAADCRDAGAMAKGQVAG